MYKSCVANGSLEGCDFLSARINIISHTNSGTTTKLSINIYRVEDKWCGRCYYCYFAKCLPFHFTFTFNSNPIVYFVIHLTHIIRHIEWRYTHIFKQLCCGFVLLLEIWDVFLFIVWAQVTEIEQKNESNLKGGFVRCDANLSAVEIQPFKEVKIVRKMILDGGSKWRASIK